MNLQEIIDHFFEERREGSFYESSSITYRRKLMVFIDYLATSLGVTEENFEDVLRGMGTTRIINSIDFYVNKYDIKFKVTAENYFTVIKAFFEFIATNHNIKNAMFDSNQNFKKLKILVNKRILELQLNKTKQKSPITKQAFIKLVEFCDAKLSHVQREVLISDSDYNTTFNSYLSALITKLLMLTGIKNKVINTILINDFDHKLNRLKINNYWIHLPNNFSEQLQNYLEIRKKILEENNTDTDLLFINRQGDGLGSSYATMFKVLSDILKTQKAECVSKYTIIQMIKTGINPSIIQEFTGFSFETYMHCQELLEEEQNSQINILEKTRYLDSKIRSMTIFDEL